jgi:hypothetical protein
LRGTESGIHAGVARRRVERRRLNDVRRISWERVLTIGECSPSGCGGDDGFTTSGNELCPICSSRGVNAAALTHRASGGAEVRTRPRVHRLPALRAGYTGPPDAFSSTHAINPPPLPHVRKAGRRPGRNMRGRLDDGLRAHADSSPPKRPAP